MPKTPKTQINEFESDDKTSTLPEPVGKDGHSGRSADKSGNGETAPKQFATKVEAINAAVSALAPFSTQEISDFLAGLGSEKNARPQDKKVGDSKSPAQLTKEDIDELFSGDELTEEQKEKATTIFEAAVNARLTVETVRLEEEFETRLTEAVTEIRDELTGDVDTYLNHVAEQYVADNKLAIESQTKVQLAESLINGMTKLLGEHNIILPESIDVVEDLSNKNETLVGKLAEAVEIVADLEAQIVEYKVQEIFHEQSEGLTVVQSEKLRELAEGIEYDSAEEFETKLTTIKESIFDSKKPKSNLEEQLTEEYINEDSEDTGIVSNNPNINSVVSFLRRSK